ncbi:GNAT family N-acetyltransferase [Marinimicrobium sp. ABcell2]|uniref:GNAT family N-acetyltransferase n=1 Tax=Marinimicrobium sp. ABcell2 TaxID=3069751 RepID=UPI0027B1450B|nr:GNAT family N-acetyltransferase [Marinimicrobium sp. ABcell2]MDQ2075836.1 GNAT family N-acetyltransferase [Marinimicrobium sp. ABcell2]
MLSLIQAKARLDACADALQSRSSDIKAAFFSETPAAYALLADLGGEIVGLVTYYFSYSTFLGRRGIWVDDLYVYPDYREQGIGKALAGALCKVAIETGCTRVDSTVPIEIENEKVLRHVLGARVFEELRHIRINEPGMKKLARAAEGVFAGQ